MPSLLISVTIPSLRSVSPPTRNKVGLTHWSRPLQEPKLSAARRIVAEWTDYDEEMFRLGEQIVREREEGRDQDTTRETRDEL